MAQKQQGESLPFAVLLATRGTAGGACAVPAAFGVSRALPPAPRRYALRRAGPLDAAERGK